MAVKTIRTMLGALALLSSGLFAADDAGTVTGIVASKGDTWLGVKAEGQDEPSLFMPFWKGTGFDNETLGTIKGIAIGSKVKLVWKQDDHPRIVSVETLAAPEKPVLAEKRHGPEKGPGERERMGDKERMAEKERMIAERERMAKKEGHNPERNLAIGMVISKGEAFIEVKPENQTPAEKYYPRYVAGEEGLDKEMLRIFQRLKVGEWVKIEWTTADERRRAVKIDRANQQ
jgi:hypothetical protein